MKPILFAIAALITFNTTYAQKWELGLNGGITWNTLPSFVEKTEYTGHSGLSLMGGVKVMRNSPKWQVGLSISAMQLTYINKMQFWLEDMSNPFTEESFGDKVVVANPAIPITLLVNRIVKINKLEMYGGLSAGYVYLSQRYKYFNGAGFRTYHNTGSGYTIGAQLGGTYYITRHIGLNGELNAAYMQLSLKNDYIDTFHLWAFPATLGIRYRF